MTVNGQAAQRDAGALDRSAVSVRYGIILPACDEADCIGPVLAELRAALDPERFVFVVGVNGTRDQTPEIARQAGALVAVTAAQGYGYGCRAAIDLVEATHSAMAAFIFVAADGANPPSDIAQLIAVHEQGVSMVLGCRTRLPANRSLENLPYLVANRFFGVLCGLLTGRVFADLGPLRLIDRELFHRLQLREWTYGWTIEGQLRAAMLGASIVEVDVRERRRLAGVQKVSRVSWRRTFAIGLQIIMAAVRVRFAAYPAEPPQCRLD